MAEELPREILAYWREVKPSLRRAVVRFRLALRAVWQRLRFALSFAVQVVLALILLFEEWGWRPLVAALAWLARFPLWARLELAIAGLPPYGALIALALPSAILFPLKFLALFLIAQGKVFAAGMIFVGAKIASTALIARLFFLTKPALMSIGWFRRAHDIVVPWKEAVFATIRASWVWRYGRMLKTRVRIEAKRMWRQFAPLAREALRQVRDAARRVWTRIAARPNP